MTLLCLLPLSTMVASAPNAREASLESRIETARQTFSELDARAAACLNASDNAGTDEPEPCGAFLSAIDGALTADYLADCTALRQWRDEFITAPDSDNETAGDTERNLQRMRDIEFYCGEDALSRRTENVQAAFNRIRSAQLMTRQLPAGRTLQQLEFERALLELRRQGSSTLTGEQRRLNRETERLWKELELELIRQQIDTLKFR